MYLGTHAHVTTIREKDAMNFKNSREVHGRAWSEENEGMKDVIIISKYHIIFKM